jgi:CO dehydrogenase/acetyl-CoA synthase gamma subunit (corrinoid Fe-S protein)
MSKEKQCWICRRTEQEVKALLEKLSPEIPRLATDKDDAVMVSAKTDLFRDELKGIYRCVVCECLLMDMAEHAITERTKEDLLTEGDLERIHFDISATIDPNRKRREHC